MSVSYSTAVNIIAILSIIFGLIRRFYISWINKKEKQIERERIVSWDRDKPPREEAKSDVRIYIFIISSILFIILFQQSDAAGSRVESGTLAEALGLLIYAFAVWLPVEVGVIAMVGGLLYVILQHEGFTTG